MGLKKLLMIFVSICILTTTLPLTPAMAKSARGQNQTKNSELIFRQDCDKEVYGLAKMCEKAVREQIKVIQAQDKYIKEQGQFIEIQERELQRRAKVMKMLEEENAAWYKNPYITILLGVAAGGLASQAVR